MSAKPDYLIVEDIAHALFERRRGDDTSWDNTPLDIILQYRADARAAYAVLYRAEITDLGERVANGIDAERRKYDVAEKDADLYNRGILFGFSVAARIARNGATS